MASSADLEMEGWLKKKSPKTTTAKKAIDSWQRRYFVLSGGELRYYKTEKAAHMSNGEPLKSIDLEQVVSASINPRHPEAFVVDLGQDRKVKLQATGAAERDAWVAAIEAAKRKHAGRQSGENKASNVIGGGHGGSRASGGHAGAAAVIPPAGSRPFGTPLAAKSGAAGVELGAVGGGAASPSQIEAELLRVNGGGGKAPHGCCIVS